jgi:CheY-like chemotaxis protein|tara:strand:+ start:939 stop:1658 length:720 start_codon:yes stop_codon:yes gene_type:complete
MQAKIVMPLEKGRRRAALAEEGRRHAKGVVPATTGCSGRYLPHFQPNSAIIISHCQCEKSWLLPSFSLGPKLTECGAFFGPDFVKCYHKVPGFLSWKWYLMAPNSPVILHVDNEQDTLEIVKLALEFIGGLEVIQCDSGTQALEVAKEYVPDLLLLDVMMPEIDGIETLRWLREIPTFEHTPVIFLTAKVMPEDQKMLLECGAVSIIQKPFDSMTIASDIVEIWNKAFQDRMTKELRPH